MKVLWILLGFVAPPEVEVASGSNALRLFSRSPQVEGPVVKLDLVELIIDLFNRLGRKEGKKRIVEDRPAVAICRRREPDPKIRARQADANNRVRAADGLPAAYAGDSVNFPIFFSEASIM